jgi:hypothetical protein
MLPAHVRRTAPAASRERERAVVTASSWTAGSSVRGWRREQFVEPLVPALAYFGVGAIGDDEPQRDRDEPSHADGCVYPGLVVPHGEVPVWDQTSPRSDWPATIRALIEAGASTQRITLSPDDPKHSSTTAWAICRPSASAAATASVGSIHPSTSTGRIRRGVRAVGAMPDRGVRSAARSGRCPAGRRDGAPEWLPAGTEGSARACSQCQPTGAARIAPSAYGSACAELSPRA